MSSKTNGTVQEKRAQTAAKKLVVKAKQATDKVQHSVLKAADRNGDGKITAEDFGITKEAMLGKAQKLKNGAVQIGEKVSDAKENLDRRVLRPVFTEDICCPENTSALLSTTHIPSLICIVERDKKRADKTVCTGEIGYWTSVKGAEILNLYEESAARLGLQFLPNITQTFYYMDPYKPLVYVSLDGYFAYLKKNRVNELELIAQSLGAKSFRVTFKEHQKVIVKQAADGGLKVKANKAALVQNQASHNYDKIEIAAETQFSGHCEPKVPALVYFRNESDIEKLIRMRLDQSNPIKSKDFCFQCSSTSGMTEKTAAKIDLVLRQMKCVGTATLSSEVQREGRTELEYHIEF